MIGHIGGFCACCTDHVQQMRAVIVVDAKVPVGRRVFLSHGCATGLPANDSEASKVAQRQAMVGWLY